MKKMKKIKLFLTLLLSLFSFTFTLYGHYFPVPAIAQNVPEVQIPSEPASDPIIPPFESSDSSTLKPFEEVIKDTEKLEGLFTFYRQKKSGKIYLEVKPEQLNRNFLCAIALGSGIGEGELILGMPLRDFMFQFRQVENKLHFVIPNVNFRNNSEPLNQQAIANSFSDSVLYSLPIQSIHPERKTFLIELNELMLTQQDLPGLSSILPWILGAPYTLDRDKSYFGTVKAFPMNIEIESIYGFSGGGEDLNYIPSIPDSRAFNLSLRYSISELPVNNGYRPRLADEQVGYFITAYQDFGNDSRRDPFVRFINRWNLQKQDPNALLSPPKEPIVFWIENTVPEEYRSAIREGILMWNKAFEKAGFLNAIEVQQMPDNATWDPADVRYNTIRWSTNFWTLFIGFGPSRANPLTGEILDSDIILDGNFVRMIKSEYRTLMQQNPSEVNNIFTRLLGNGNPCFSDQISAILANEETQGTPPRSQLQQRQSTPWVSQLIDRHDMCFGMESTQQFAMGNMALSLVDNVLPSSDKMQAFVHQYLRYITAHEVGHALGLRHNFHGSTLLSPEELNDPVITSTKGLVASVMDYVPINLAPMGQEQGDYFSGVVGPYDQWAIEYGYKPIDAPNPQMELRELKAIADQAVENPELAYAPDEDAWDILNPAANVFDLSSDMLKYSQWQMENARQMWTRLNTRYPRGGESSSEVQDMFDTVFFYYFRNVLNTTLYVGGQSFSRSSGKQNTRRLPFEAIPVEKQREALATLQEYVFDQDAFQFPPELLNKLVPSRWFHWGTFPVSLNTSIHDQILFVQRVVLKLLLSDTRLSRLRDLELKTPPGQALIMPELFDTLEQGIWTEVIDSKGNLTSISSIRRGLQREHLNLLIGMILRTSSAPEDARSLAWYNLRELSEYIDTTLRRNHRHLDTSTKAHLEETRARIQQTLDAQLQSR